MHGIIRFEVFMAGEKQPLGIEVEAAPELMNILKTHKVTNVSILLAEQLTFGNLKTPTDAELKKWVG